MDYSDLDIQNQPEYQAPTPEHPMKWYKFLIYFCLWAGGILNIVSSLPYLTGSIYEGQVDLVYAVFPNLQYVDIFLAVAMIALGAFCIYTRYSLAKFEAKGPTLLLFVYLANIIIPIVYLFASYSIIDITPEMDSSTIASLVVSFIMIIVNKIYFDKRKDLFVN